MNHHILCIGIITVSIDGQCLKNSLYMALNGKNTSISNEKLIKKCDEDINKGYMLEVHICRMQFVYLKKTTLRTLKL